MPTFGPVQALVGLLYIFLILIVALILVHVVIAIAVYDSAKELRSPALELPPWVWAVLTFTVPALGMLCYWLMNHSTLARKR